MDIKINSVEDIVKNIKYIPKNVIEDIDKRITHWLASGGTFEDSYIKQQFRYVENVINYKRRGVS